MKKLLAKIKSLRSQGYGRGRIAEELGVTQHTVRTAFAELEKLQSVEDITIIIPDTHADPSEPNDRFIWLGKEIALRNPKRVIQLGDFADMYSLNSFDRGKISMEGKRYKQDIAVSLDAMDKLMTPINKAGVHPELIMLEGNHEYRITRAIQEDPRLEGTISTEDLRFSEYGWTVHPYKSIVTIDNVSYSHHFSHGRMGRPVTGSKQHISKLMHSTVSGHSHVFDLAFATRVNGEEIFSLVAGCFFEKKLSYTDIVEHRTWWRGITILKKDSEGRHSFEFVTLANLRDKHSR